jgi:hypothetical protein
MAGAIASAGSCRGASPTKPRHFGRLDLGNVPGSDEILAHRPSM